MKGLEHIKCHEELHKKLDSLIADFMIHTGKLLLSKVTVMELMKWSYQQTINPTEPKGE